jgi:hypothetical protein
VATTPHGRAFPGVWLSRALPLVPPIALLFLIRAFAVNVPFWDEWVEMPFVLAVKNGTVKAAHFWAQHNEHRIAAVKLIMFPVILATDFDVTALMYVGFAIQLAAFLLLWSSLRTTLKSRRPLILPLSVAIALLMFSPAQEETWLWGLTSLAWHLCNLTVAVTVWAFVRWPGRRVGPIVGFAATFVGMLSLACGIVLWGAVLGALLIEAPTSESGRRRSLLVVVWLIGALVLAGVYFAGFRAPWIRPRNQLGHFRELVKFVLVYVGSPLVLTTRTGLAAVAGSAGVSLFLVAAVIVSRRPRLILVSTPWILLSVYSLLIGATMAVGRLDLGVVQATMNRYTSVSIMFWVGLIVIGGQVVFDPERSPSSSRSAVALRILVWTLAVAWSLDQARLYRKGYRSFENSRESRSLGLAALYRYREPDRQALRTLHSDVDSTRVYAVLLERQHLGPFSDRQVGRSGGVPAARTVGQVVAPQGVLDVADCTQIAGWAWDAQWPDVPVKVDVYAGEELLGTVTAQQFREDLADAGVGNGRHGYFFADPAVGRDGRKRLIRVMISGTRVDVSGTPKELACR